MKRGLKALLLFSKAIRSFHDGIFSSFLIYFYFYTFYYGAPIYISLTTCGAVIAAVVKSKIIAKIKAENEIVILLLTYFFYLIPRYAVYYIFFVLQKGKGDPKLMTLFVLGLLPVDG